VGAIEKNLELILLGRNLYTGIARNLEEIMRWEDVTKWNHILGVACLVQRQNLKAVRSNIGAFWPRLTLYCARALLL
jgi:hypothetical protein